MDNPTPTRKPDDPLDTTLAFLKTYAENLGEPIDLSEAAYQKLIAERREKAADLRDIHQFCLFTDLKTGQIDAAIGMFEAMGWPTKGFDVAAFFQKIHPDCRTAYLNWTVAAYQTALELAGKSGPLETRYQVSVPLQHGSGKKFYWYLMTVTPTRFDAAGRMTTHANEFLRLEEMTEFNARILSPALFDRLENPEGWTRLLREKMAPSALKGMSEKDLTILRLAVKERPTPQIAIELASAKNTVMGHKKRLLGIGSQACGRPFRDAQAVGRFYQMMGWL